MNVSNDIKGIFSDYTLCCYLAQGLCQNPKITMALDSIIELTQKGKKYSFCIILLPALLAEE